jgi:hypothetical protein
VQFYNYWLFLVLDVGHVSCAGRGEEGQLGYGGKQEHWFPRKLDILVPELSEAEIEALPEDQRVPMRTILAVRAFCGANSTTILTCKSRDFSKIMSNHVCL